MLSVFLLSICLIPRINTVNINNIPNDSLHLVYRYLQNVDRHKVFASINKKMASVHRSETLETRKLMNEMDSFFQPNCIGDHMEDIHLIHNKLWLNERYHATLPMQLRIWKGRIQRSSLLQSPTPMEIFNEIVLFIDPVLSTTCPDEMNKLLQCSRNIQVTNSRDVRDGYHRISWTFQCLLYPLLWNQIAVQTNALLPPLESMYYLKEIEGANSEKIQHLKLLTDRGHLKLIHHRFRNPDLESMRMGDHSMMMYYGIPILKMMAVPPEWIIPLTANWLITWMKNDSAENTFRKMVKWTNSAEHRAFENFVEHTLEPLLDRLWDQNDDESNRLLQEILMGLQRHHAVFCMNINGFFSRISFSNKFVRSDDRYANFIGTMIHTLSNDMNLDTAKKVARSIQSWRFHEIEWGTKDIKPDLTETMNILCDLAEDEKYDDRLPDELMRLLSPEFDLLWDLIVDTDGYLRWAFAILKGGQREIGKGELNIHWHPRSRFSLKGREHVCNR